MIPKIVHYCWFGKGDIFPLAKKCIGSWKRYLPGYELKQWNEDNFDLDSNMYARQAYELKRYAYVADYVRLYALHNFGGIYMDVDVELLKNLDYFLKFPAFTGFEDEENVSTGVMGSIKNSEWIKGLLACYARRVFILPDNKIDTSSNVAIVANSLREMGLVPNNQYQVIGGTIHVFPSEYFYPKSLATGEVVITPNTFCIHHFSASWMSYGRRLLTRIKWSLIKFLGVKTAARVVSFLRLKKVFRNKIEG